MPEPEVDLELSEQERVVRRRYREAKKAGFSRLNAELFATSDADVGVLRQLVAAGCPVREMTRILRPIP